MSIELKIKSKHLSEESKIIRFEERKLKKQAAWQRRRQLDCKKVESKFRDIQSHRRSDVRREARATFLARAFLEGKPYKTVESKCKDKFTLKYYVADRVLVMVNKYRRGSPIEEIATKGKFELQEIYSWLEI